MLEWVRHLLRPGHEEEPPPLEILPVPTVEEHDSFIEKQRSTIEHRERILRVLEARARVRTGRVSEE